MRSYLPLFGALLTVLWAALLAVAEGALAAEPQLADTAPPVLLEKPERLRRALAIGRITLLGLAALTLSGALRWWARPVVAASLWFLATVAAVVLAADLLPRLLGLTRAARVGPWAVRLTGATLAPAAPLFVAAGILDRAFGRLFGVAAPKTQAGAAAQRDMLFGVFALADTMVAEVMTPRVDIVGLDASTPFDEVVRRVAATERSRLPVFHGDVDHIVGLLYAKDLLPARFGHAGDVDWRALVRPVGIVPEVKTLDRQLRDFQRGPEHMAVVVDEFGGTAGIVTLEDVLEEIVGEIADEYDAVPPTPVSETAPGIFTVDGRAGLTELMSALGLALEHEEVTTAGGYVYAALGHVPQPGETLEVPGWRITVERIERRSIARLRFERVATPEPGGVGR